MKALIVDDERLARGALRRLLREHKDVEIVGEASNAEEALHAAEKSAPDVMFLDIEMPGCNGFELLEKMEDVPAVIFTTAYDEYAVRAFEVSALDYLVKPITAERLAAALARVASSRDGKSPLQQIFVRDRDRCWMVRLADIRLMESEGNYTRLYFGANAPLVYRSLTAIEQRLGPSAFFRANRAQIVNLNWVEHMETDEDGRLIVRLREGKQIEVSRRQSRRLRELLSL